MQPAVLYHTDQATATSMNTGRVFAERCKRGSTARGIHMCKIYDRIA